MAYALSLASLSLAWVVLGGCQSPRPPTSKAVALSPAREAARLKGAEEAHALIVQGKLAFIMAGLPPVDLFERTSAEYSKHGITLQISGDVLSDEVVGRVDGFDDAMAAAITAKFGPHFFEEVDAQVRAAGLVEHRRE
jgi:hypothetical protein